MQERNNIQESTGVLILSSDKYSDTWYPFFTLLFRYWNNVPYKVYLGTNTKTYSDPRVTSIKSGAPKDWSRDVYSIVKQIREKYIIVLLEDYFLTGSVDQELITKSLELMDKEDAKFMRLACFPVKYNAIYKFKSHPTEDFAVVTEPNAMYSITLQAGIWNTRALEELILKGESPWDFEIEASKRAAEKKYHLLGVKPHAGETYVHGPIPYLCTAVTKGVWMREALEICEKENIDADFSQRPVESVSQQRKRKLKSRLPWIFQSLMDKLSG